MMSNLETKMGVIMQKKLFAVLFFVVSTVKTTTVFAMNNASSRVQDAQQYQILGEAYASKVFDQFTLQVIEVAAETSSLQEWVFMHSDYLVPQAYKAYEAFFNGTLVTLFLAYIEQLPVNHQTARIDRLKVCDPLLYNQVCDHYYGKQDGGELAQPENRL